MLSRSKVYSRGNHFDIAETVHIILNFVIMPSIFLSSFSSILFFIFTLLVPYVVIRDYSPVRIPMIQDLPRNKGPKSPLAPAYPKPPPMTENTQFGDLSRLSRSIYIIFHAQLISHVTFFTLTKNRPALRDHGYHVVSLSSVSVLCLSYVSII